jgi:hypothetical protein
VAKQNVSAFDELLTTFSTEEDRQAFSTLAERNPAVREFGMRKSDYSRKLDELRDDIDELGKWRSWREQHWDAEHEMTKAELAKQKALEATQEEKERLESQLLLEGMGGDMGSSFEDFDKFLKEKGVITAADLQGKEKELQDYVAGVNRFSMTASLRVPYLNAKHAKEFGDMFDPDEFVKTAVRQGRFEDMDKFYEEQYATPARTEKQRRESEATLKAKDEELATERAKREAAERTAASVAGGAPVDTDGSTMGALQRRYLGLDKKEEGSGAPEVELGEGSIATYAAREFANNRAGR